VPRICETRSSCTWRPTPSPGGHLMATTVYRWFDAARREADRPDLRFHDLRHTGLTLAAHARATLADLMNRAGHKSVTAAQVYMHAAKAVTPRLPRACRSCLAVRCTSPAHPEIRTEESSGCGTRCGRHGGDPNGSSVLRLVAASSQSNWPEWKLCHWCKPSIAHDKETAPGLQRFKVRERF
jgi:hypothetical protein